MRSDAHSVLALGRASRRICIPSPVHGHTLPAVQTWAGANADSSGRPPTGPRNARSLRCRRHDGTIQWADGGANKHSRPAYVCSNYM